MVNSLTASSTIVVDTWVEAAWDEFLALANDPELENARFYYDQGYMRIEIMLIGSSHAQDNSIISRVVSLFATLKAIRIKELINGSFRKAGIRECQPDIAFYIGSDFALPPRSDTPIDVAEYGPPTLVIEIASTTLSDDLGSKRLLYERLGVQEYWVINVKASEVVAFEVLDGGSKQIQESRVLPGLMIATVEFALQRSQTEDDGAINRWLIQEFS
jgi:Uma2 family endonuclease